MRRKILSLLIVLALCVTGCSTAADTEGVPYGYTEESSTALEVQTAVVSISVSGAESYADDEIVMTAGDTATVSIQYEDDTAGTYEGGYDLISDNEDIVTVDDMSITAIAEGTAVLTISAEDIGYEEHITVTAAAASEGSVGEETTAASEGSVGEETTAAADTESVREQTTAAVETTAAAETAAAATDTTDTDTESVREEGVSSGDTGYVLTTDASTIVERMRQANYLKSQTLGGYWDLCTAAMNGERITITDQDLFISYYMSVFSFVDSNGSCLIYTNSKGSRIEATESDSTRASAIAATISTIGISQVTDPAQAVSDAVARVRAAISYSTSARYYTLEQSLSAGIGVCAQMNDALYIILNAEDIPTRLVRGTASYGSTTGDHLWCECYYNGSWHTVDAVSGVSGYSETIPY